MASNRVHYLPIPLIALLAVVPLVKAECYVAAYGLVGAQDGWNACPGTAKTAGGVETCCMPDSECGEDSLCHIPDTADGTNAWYQAGCTDPNYADSVCRNNCVDYTQTYVQYEDSTSLWMCCGDGGCNGTITDDTFQAVAPQNWKEITGGSSSVSSNAGSSKTSSPNSASSTSTSNKNNAPSSADFKPSPISSSGAGAASTRGVNSTSSNSNYQPAGLSTGVKAGLGVGITLAALALIAALVAIFLLKRRRSIPSAVDEKVIASTWSSPPASAPHSAEVSGESKYSELPMQSQVFELAVDAYSINKR